MVDDKLNLPNTELSSEKVEGLLSTSNLPIVGKNIELKDKEIL